MFPLRCSCYYHWSSHQFDRPLPDFCAWTEPSSSPGTQIKQHQLKTQSGLFLGENQAVAGFCQVEIRNPSCSKDVNPILLVSPALTPRQVSPQQDRLKRDRRSQQFRFRFQWTVFLSETVRSPTAFCDTGLRVVFCCQVNRKFVLLTSDLTPRFLVYLQRWSWSRRGSVRKTPQGP